MKTLRFDSFEVYRSHGGEVEAAVIALVRVAMGQALGHEKLTRVDRREVLTIDGVRHPVEHKISHFKVRGEVKDGFLERLVERCKWANGLLEELNTEKSGPKAPLITVENFEWASGFR